MTWREAGLRTSRIHVVGRRPGHRSGPVPDSHRLPRFSPSASVACAGAGPRGTSCLSGVTIASAARAARPATVSRDRGRHRRRRLAGPRRSGRARVVADAEVVLGGARHLGAAARRRRARSASRGRRRCATGCPALLDAVRRAATSSRWPPATRWSPASARRWSSCSARTRCAIEPARVLGRAGPGPDGLAGRDGRGRHAWSAATRTPCCARSRPAAGCWCCPPTTTTPGELARAADRARATARSRMTVLGDLGAADESRVDGHRRDLGRPTRPA